VADAERGDGEALDQGRLLGEPRGERPTERLADGYLSGHRQWSIEPDVGRVAHGVPARVDRLRSLGNAVVPQVVEVIGRRILEA
jgi:DNA (cytosine-5)-methyltransferase 1